MTSDKNGIYQMIETYPGDGNAPRLLIHVYNERQGVSTADRTSVVWTQSGPRRGSDKEHQ